MSMRKILIIVRNVLICEETQFEILHFFFSFFALFIVTISQNKEHIIAKNVADINIIVTDANGT